MNNKKKRLATSRGFGLPDSYGGVPPSGTSSFITPQNSPSFKLHPVAKSTPASEDNLLSPCYSARPSVLQNRKSLPPRPPSPLPGVTSIGVSVISPTPLLSSNDVSLVWDNYEYSYPTNLEGINCNVLPTLPGLEDIDNLVTNTIPVVSTSESSISVSSFTRKMSVFSQCGPEQMDSATRSQIQRNMETEANEIWSLLSEFEDMLGDFTAEDVNRGNLVFVKEKLDDISAARSHLRKCIRRYKQLYGSYGDQDNRLEDIIKQINEKVRSHANNIWSKVEELQADQYTSSSVGHQNEMELTSGRQSEGQLAYESKKLIFKDQLRLLKDSLCIPEVDSIPEHWSQLSNSEVCRAMRKIGDWEKSLVQISSTFREYEKLSKQFNEDASERDSVLNDFIEIRNQVKEVCTAVQFEDIDRNLQTLQPFKPETVKYPTFSGEPGEDLLKFKNRMSECFLKNRVPKNYQLDILRENLKGAALKRVPDTLKDLSVAWQNLHEAFGSPLLVLKERLKSLAKVGSIPPDCNASKQITWFHEFESIIQDIIDLGSCDDLNMQMGAFGPNVQDQVLRALNDNPYIKRKVAMSGTGKQPKEKMEAFKNKIIELRREVQLTEIESCTAEKRNSRQNNTGNQAHVSFNLSKNAECRVCLHLEATGKDSSMVLFEKHLGKRPIGCPNFMKMKSKARRSFTLSVKLCQFCLDENVIYTTQHGRECSTSKKSSKSTFTCNAPGCAKHFWVCSDHEEDNREKYAAANKKLSKFGLQVSNIAVSMSAHISGSNSNAMERLAGQVRKELIPVPEGEPLFLFFGAKGRTREIMTFFDDGCSKCVIKEDVIQSKELPATMIRKGPINLGGVGDTRVFASGEYLIAMDRDEKRAQTLQGLAVEVITGDFPVVDISAAVAAVKMDNQRNKYLQNCKFPKAVGGSVDALIGIQYNVCQPKLIHMMHSGLAIYETTLMPHTKNLKYVLGGPHSSFDVLLSRYPNANLLLNDFKEGIARWKSLGPPSLTQYIMSTDEVSSACRSNISYDDLKNYADLVDENKGESYVTENPLDPEALSNLQCIDCGEENSSEYFAALETDRLSQLRQLVDIQEAGLEISYRCVRCRSCIDCKNAEKVDKISLREEAELCEIKSSIHLDWNERKIICSLPLRGPERDFLSSNYERALKILNAQCRKYHQDNATKISILEAFGKLFNKGYIKLVKDIPPDTLQKFIQKEVQYYLPWRIQFKPDSASTPARPVFDGSSCTRKRLDGSAGRCLNDAVVKGPIDTLDLMKVTLRFMIGNTALVADLTKMYNQFHLVPENWNLQRILFKANLDPEAPVQEGAITTLIYGVKSTACQSETGLDDIAEHVKTEKPAVYKFLKDGRYVDNLMDSMNSLEEAEALGVETTEVLDRLSLKTKGFTFSGGKPQPDETTDGVSIDVNGYRWFPELDVLEPKIPPLHFAKKSRGRVVDTEYFPLGGDFDKMDLYVPKKLTRRMIVSKRASIYEALGKLEPIKAKLKIDEREAVSLTSDWDDAVPTTVRNKWLHNFLLIEKLRGLRFTRARIPINALDTKMRLITLVDAAEQIVNVVAYCGFRLKGGGYSNQHLIGRSVLGTSTIPRNELQGLTGGSNLSCIIRKALYDWIESSILAGDSEIALHWNISDSRKLSMWHRNRVIQIRRGTELENLYHVGTEHNVADVGTRADKICIEDIGPESRYENGDKWMQLEFSEIIQQGFLRPALDLKTAVIEDDEDFKKGFIFEREPEILTRGHATTEGIEVSVKGRIDKIAERAAYSNYGKLLPTRRNFPSMVRITSYVLIFVKKCLNKLNTRRGTQLTLNGPLLKESCLWFSAFPTRVMDVQADPVHVAWINSKPAEGNYCPLLEAFLDKNSDVYTRAHTLIKTLLPTDSYLNAALLLYFRLASREVEKFNSKQFIEKHMVLKDGILLSKGRIIDGMNFIETAELDMIDLGDLGIKTMIPVIDRYSPLSYAIAQHIHWTVIGHKGMETCLRASLEHVHIIQGMSLFRELNNECIRCKMKRGKFIKVATGPIGQKQLLVAPPFYACQVDLFGPLRTFVPGFERETRSSKVKESKVWIFTSVCVVTSNVNLQVIEMKDAGTILEALVRLGCEVGYPKYMYCDQESSIIKVFKEINLNLRDLFHRAYTENGVIFETCSVGGHDAHGKVERTIKSMQESLHEVGFDKMRIHALGIQTLCKQIENAYNNLPLGYRFDRSHDNTPLVKLLVPNMLRIGKINSRAMDGPVKLSADASKMLSDIQKKYETWFRIWLDSYVPKLLTVKRHFQSSRDLAPSDVVYFQKDKGGLGSPWTMGIVDQIIRGRDGKIRRVIIKYRNHKEEFDRITDRSVKGLIKLYSIDDPDLHKDLSKIQQRIDELIGNYCQEAEVDSISHNNLVLDRNDDLNGLDNGFPSRSDMLQDKCNCCCQAHCHVSFHNCYGTRTFRQELSITEDCTLEAQTDNFNWDMEDELEEETLIDDFSSILFGTRKRMD